MTTRTPGPRSPPFDVSVRGDDPDTLVVRVQGELDLLTGPILAKHLESYNDPSGRPRKVEYVLPELSFIDARGLHYLLNAVNGSVPETITIREPLPSVRRVLEVLGLDSMIEGDPD